MRSGLYCEVQLAALGRRCGRTWVLAVVAVCAVGDQRTTTRCATVPERLQRSLPRDLEGKGAQHERARLRATLAVFQYVSRK